MPVNVIAMLTNNDMTVENALDIFKKNQHSIVKCWGFKDIGIKLEDAVALVEEMKAAGKTTFLEPLVETEEECLAAANFAVKCKFDYLVAMVFYESAWKVLRENNVKFIPTCGKRAGLPRKLYGTPESIIEDAQRIAAYGVNGIGLSVYRYMDGDPEDLARKFVQNVKIPMIISGSINSEKRLDFVKSLGPWGFTIGSALFDESFCAGMSIQGKLDYLQNYLKD